MEPATDFRLSEALDAWRASFIRNPAVSADDVRELEDHLLLTFEKSIARGVDPLRAFESAQFGLGSAADLAGDYRRTTTPLRLFIQTLTEIDMKHSLALSIAFAAILLAATTYVTRDQAPRFQLETTNGRTVRIDTQTGEVCSIPQIGDRSEDLHCWSDPGNGSDTALATVSGRIQFPPQSSWISAFVSLDGDLPNSGTMVDQLGRFQLRTKLTGPQTIRMSVDWQDYAGNPVRRDYRIDNVQLTAGKTTELSYDIPSISEGS